MATIYPNKKEGKIISVKLKAYLGRDEHGKQIFRCKNWIPEKDITEKKLLALAEKEAILFEYEAAARYEEERKAFKGICRKSIRKKAAKLYCKNDAFI